MDYIFFAFCVLASLNHSISYVGTYYSSSLLSPEIASVSLGLLWGANAFAGLLLASSLTSLLGLRLSLITAFAGYAVQIGCLYYSIAYPSNAWTLSIIGTGFAGLTSAIWWNAQALVVEGACAKAIVRAKALHDSQSTTWPTLESIRSSNNAIWTFTYQGVNMLVFLSLSLLQFFFPVSLDTLIFGLFVAGCLSTVGVALLPLPRPDDDDNTNSLVGEGLLSKQQVEAEEEKMTGGDDAPAGGSFLDVLRLFRDDYRCALLAPTQLAFGISTALFAYYVNMQLISGVGEGEGEGEGGTNVADDGFADTAKGGDVGILYLGLLEAFAYLVSATAAFPYSYLVRRHNALSAIMMWGNFSFLLAGLVILCVPVEHLKSWGLLLLLKALYGAGRGVFEGENRSYYANLFAGAPLVTAFSQQGFLTGFSGGVFFLLSSVLSPHALATISALNGVIAIGCLELLAQNVARRKDETASGDDLKWHWSTLVFFPSSRGSDGANSVGAFVRRKEEEGVGEPLLCAAGLPIQ